MFRDRRQPDYLAPARPATVDSDVFVPLLQAIVTAIAAAIVAGIVVLMAGWSWWLPVVAGLVVFVWTWVRLMSEHNEHMWTKQWHERPEEAPASNIQHVTRLTVQVAGGRLVEAEFPIPHDVLVKIARGVVNAKRPFSEREWSGQGRLLSSPAEFREIRDTLISMELLAWKDEERRNLGVDWTPEGWATLQRLAAGESQEDRMVRNV